MRASDIQFADEEFLVGVRECANNIGKLTCLDTLTVVYAPRMKVLQFKCIIKEAMAKRAEAIKQVEQPWNNKALKIL